MKKEFLDQDFLLSTETARTLYHYYAVKEPIFDYHCHLILPEIAENRRFHDLAQVWLGGDHYKWRVMRANGIDEDFITGSAEPYEKFLAWAKTVPHLIGNPLYHWTHLELQRYFNIYEPLCPSNAKEVWQEANKQLQSADWLSVYGIFNRFNVYAVGTTDDPADDLHWHEQIAQSGATKTKVLPSFRPDNALTIDNPSFLSYITKLGDAAGLSITSLDKLCEALAGRIAFFDKHGCKISDHALEYVPFVDAKDAGHDRISGIFAAVLKGRTISAQEAEAYKTFILQFLAKEYRRYNWAMQLHLASLRNVNSRMTAKLGINTGYDVVHDHPIAAKLALFLDSLESNDALPKTILYSLNPKDFYPLATIMGSFQGGGIPGKMQLGSSWWFLDSKDGMKMQMKLLANVGLLSRFVGMLTDSRSFLSYPRHEYFRRILCAILGTWAENGEIANDKDLLGEIVRDISFRNAQRYFET
ncbi:MAG: glucuronate isomerase [Spirochaetaceae bacterium]|jgi:glucuronate isomerase|nr:glucuronate isomerase [Spirochaetaceae bacterium]